MRSLFLQKTFTLFLLFIGLNYLSAQIEVTDAATAPYTPENLITNVFLGEGVIVNEVNFNGIPSAAGFFKDGFNSIGIDRGIVLTTGAAATNGAILGVDNNGQSFASTNNNSPANDPDIQAISNVPVFNVMEYEIKFIPTLDTVEFRYVWASEEYPEFSCSAFNDVFGFFISGPGINGPYENNGENIALIPGTTLPVAINSVHPDNGAGCPAAFPEFYNDNNGTGLNPVYDGYTDVFTARAIVVPCEEYTIKLLIADGGDGIFDSGVFLEAKSFGTGTLDVEIQTVSLDGTVSEGCAEAMLNFCLPSPVEEDFLIEFDIFGTADNGIDYELIPTSLTILAGDSCVSVPLIAIQDGIAEGLEEIAIEVQRDVCTLDTFYINIQDNPLVDDLPELGPDIDMCLGDTVMLDALIDIPLPPDPVFTFNTNTNIDPVGTSVLAPINVFNVQPPVLQPGVIQQVCVNIQHGFLGDIDLFLVAPNGSFIELSTDNGSNGNNYEQTCFTPDATTPIDYIAPPASGAPYTGEFGIEGVWSDLWGNGENPTNGEWNLLVIDDQNGFEGVLLDWSISFQATYDIFYTWTPSAGLSCDDCPQPMAFPTDTTTYIVDIIDSFGCTFADTITLNVQPAADAPVITCDSITEEMIIFGWTDVPTSMGYEVNVNGTGWVPASGPLEHLVNGLSFSELVTIEVRAIGTECPGLSGFGECTTLACDGAIPSIVFVNDLQCNSDNTGVVQGAATGNFPPYIFEIDDNAGNQNTTGLFFGLAAGDHIFSIIDAGGCKTSIPFVVEEPAVLTAQEEIIVNPACYGETEGEITAIVSGGTWPYTFNWNNGESMDSVYTNIGAGDYEVQIMDANLCPTSASLEIQEAPEITAASNVPIQIQCGGDSTAVAQVFGFGGTGNFTYNWGEQGFNQITSQATNLPSGIYIVTITDENLCAITEEVIITDPVPVTLDSMTVDASCNGFTDGEATVIAMGGTIASDYNYLWDNNAGNQNTQTATELSVGVYSVTVSDIFGCEAETEVEITSPNAMMFDVQTGATSCTNTTDGTISVGVSGGAGGYEFTWSDGNGDPDLGDRMDMPSGMGSVVVTDDNGCFENIMFDIPTASTIEVLADSTAVSCFNGGDGTATAIPSGGAGGFTFQWDANALNQVTDVATGLAPGTYSVSVLDAANCEEILTVDVPNTDEFFVTADSIDVSCFNAADGEIQVNTTGGFGSNFTYNWSTPNGVNDQATGLTAGLYNIQVTDENNCPATVSIEVNQPTEITSMVAGNPLDCSGDPTGSALVTANGGTGDYTYEWSDMQATAQANNLAATTYYVTVFDENLCEQVDSVTLTSPELVEINIDLINDASCFEGDDGSAMVNITAGSMPFDIEWSNAQDTETATGLLAQTYTVTVTDLNDCVAEESITIGQPEALNADLIQAPPLCHDGQDGTAEVVAINYGNTAANIADFAFDWSSADNDETADGLTGGTEYTVTITDANSCELIESITIDNPQEIGAQITDSNSPSCANETDGDATVTAGGGTEPYEYLWDNNANNQDTPIATALGAGNFTVSVSDDNGCTTTADVIIDQPMVMELTHSTISVDCFGYATGAAEVNVEGGTGPYEYLWTNGVNVNSIKQVQGGDYMVTITDANGCEEVELITIEQPEAITATAVAEDVSCFEGRDGMIEVSTVGGTAPFQYSIDNQTFSGSPIFIGLVPDQYNVYVQDANGCIFNTDAQTVGEPSELMVDLGDDITILFGDPVSLDAQTINATGAVLYNWDPIGPDSLDCYDCQTVNFINNIFYTTNVIVDVVDENGCRSEDIITIIVEKIRTVDVPTGFTPNGDNLNDLLSVHGYEGTNVTNFQIFDRWGELVHQDLNFLVNDRARGWDGQFKGEPVMAGVYIWHVEVEYADGETASFKGETTLIR